MQNNINIHNTNVRARKQEEMKAKIYARMTSDEIMDVVLGNKDIKSFMTSDEIIEWTALN